MQRFDLPKEKTVKCTAVISEVREGVSEALCGSNHNMRAMKAARERTGKGSEMGTPAFLK